MFVVLGRKEVNPIPVGQLSEEVWVQSPLHMVHLETAEPVSLNVRHSRDVFGSYGQQMGFCPKAEQFGLLHEGPRVSPPLTVDVSLGGHVVREDQDMFVDDVLLEVHQSQPDSPQFQPVYVVLEV